MKKIIWITLLFIPIALYPAKIDVVNAEKIVQLVREKIIKTKTFMGSFVYSLNNKSYYGTIIYKSPNKFTMNYIGNNGSGQPYETGQRILSDGKTLWLVYKEQNIAINETLEKAKTPLIGWNITRLIREYVATLPKTDKRKEDKKSKVAEDPSLITYKNKPAHKIIFIPKSSTAGFKYINMILSPDGDILEVEAQNQMNVLVRLAISYEQFNVAVPETTFEYEPDENTQIYENILLPKGQLPEEAPE
jgi:outer membrane lipoprotein-sorting protein